MSSLKKDGKQGEEGRTGLTGDDASVHDRPTTRLSPEQVQAFLKQAAADADSFAEKQESGEDELPAGERPTKRLSIEQLEAAIAKARDQAASFGTAGPGATTDVATSEVGDQARGEFSPEATAKPGVFRRWAASFWGLFGRKPPSS